MAMEPRKYRIQNTILDTLNSPLLDDNDIEKAQKYYIPSIPVRKSILIHNELSELNRYSHGGIGH